TKEDGVTLKEDNIGLHCEADIYDKEVIERAKNKELVGWSFGFIPLKALKTETRAEGAEYERAVSELELNEVSIVDNRRLPCYAATSIECRSFEEEEHEYTEKTQKPDFTSRRRRLQLHREINA
ncbi:MAG: HK97 family phage prohead protease, partial [Acutalibacteraceae bacterium]